MNSAIKNIGKKLLAQLSLIGQTGLSIVLMITFSKWFLKRLIKNDQKQGCIILGNGPSLTYQIEEIRLIRSGHALLCVNEFPLSHLFDELKPNYYTLLDPHYWFRTHGKVSALTHQVLDAIALKTKWNITLFLPVEMKSVIAESVFSREPNEFVSFLYYNRTPVSGFRKFKFIIYDLNWGMPFAHNVLVSAIYLMIVVHYQKILVYGADHSWHEQIVITNDNILRIREDHFKYELDEKSISDREEMYEPIYKFAFTKTGEREIFKIHEIFDAYAKVHIGYWVLKEYAKDSNVKIFNLSKKSYIDAFERIIK
jgi:hypothetical protein